ncbi:MerR family transcriptional regulator [Archangium violaceum]|uniref:MerR family transcriptional regulator n=1 Tax=Archangium violaceum TaxID=83451 RepID=UPI00194E3566|nr:MerR family transcriptional regulator [Archangium violaceum]QRN95101.1 MerR family transcriptional regulator [Archangium violaceum]
MRPETLKVGELARRTGLSIRTLHHYDELGLLSPSLRTEAGYRLYTPEDVARLQRILSLRQLGFSLEEIKRCIDEPGYSAVRVLELHLARAREQLALQQELCRRLESLATQLRSAETPSVEQLVQTIEVMTMFEKYYTPEQLKELEARRQALGEDAIRQVEQEWPQLIAQVRAEMEKGTDPASEPVQRLARRWGELVRAFTGGNPGIEKSLGTMYQQEPSAGARFGLDPRLFDYVNRAMAAAKKPE